MKCRKSQILISRRSHGEVDDSAEEALLEHLENCTGCRTIASQFQHVDLLLRESLAPEMRPLLHQKIVASVTEEMRKDSLGQGRGWYRWVSRRLAAAFTVAALAAGICLGVMIGWHLSRSLDTTMVASSRDVISMAGLDAGGQDFILDTPGLGRNGGAVP